MWQKKQFLKQRNQGDDFFLDSINGHIIIKDFLNMFEYVQTKTVYLL